MKYVFRKSKAMSFGTPQGSQTNPENDAFENDVY